MPISTDPRQDTLPIPIKLYKKFMSNLVKTYTKDKLVKEVRIPEEDVSGILNSIKNISAEANSLNDNVLPRFVKINFAWRSNFKNDEENGERLFEFLQKNELKDLEQKSKTAFENLKNAANAAAIAAQNANREAEAVLNAGRNLNTLVEQANQAPAATSSPTAETPAETSTATPPTATSSPTATPPTATSSPTATAPTNFPTNLDQTKSQTSFDNAFNAKTTRITKSEWLKQLLTDLDQSKSTGAKK